MKQLEIDEEDLEAMETQFINPPVFDSPSVVQLKRPIYKRGDDGEYLPVCRVWWCGVCVVRCCGFVTCLCLV